MQDAEDSEDEWEDSGIWSWLISQVFPSAQDPEALMAKVGNHTNCYNRDLTWPPGPDCQSHPAVAPGLRLAISQGDGQILWGRLAPANTAGPWDQRLYPHPRAAAWRPLWAVGWWSRAPEKTQKKANPGGLRTSLGERQPVENWQPWTCTQVRVKLSQE